MTAAEKRTLISRLHLEVAVSPQLPGAARNRFDPRRVQIARKFGQVLPAETVLLRLREAAPSYTYVTPAPPFRTREGVRMSVLKVKPAPKFNPGKLRRLREDRGESIEQAAVRIGISYWSLYRLERERVPSLTMLLVLAEGYGVEPGELLSGSEAAA